MSDPAPDVIPYQGGHTEDDLELFGPYRNLVRVIVEGRVFYVPEGTSLLRSCQYIEMKHRAVRMPWRDYCWNDTTGCCETTIKPSANAERIVDRACRVVVRPGMEIVRLPKGGRTCNR